MDMRTDPMPDNEPATELTTVVDENYTWPELGAWVFSWIDSRGRHVGPAIMASDGETCERFVREAEERFEGWAHDALPSISAWNKRAV